MITTTMRKSRGKPFKEKTDPRFNLKYPDTKTLDEIRLRSGTVIQREVTERDRRKMMRDQIENEINITFPSKSTVVI